MCGTKDSTFWRTRDVDYKLLYTSHTNFEILPVTQTQSSDTYFIIPSICSVCAAYMYHSLISCHLTSCLFVYNNVCTIIAS